MIKNYELKRNYLKLFYIIIKENVRSKEQFLKNKVN